MRGACQPICQRTTDLLRLYAFEWGERFGYEARTDGLARRQVILLLGGDKSAEWSEWYDWAVPAADDLYDNYLEELQEEGLI